MSGKRSRDKGNRLERAVVNQLRAAGQDASRVPLSGGAGGDFQDDIIWKLQPELRLECKHRATGFKFIYDNLKPNTPLIIRADRCEPVFICTLSKAIELIGKRSIQTTTNTLESPNTETSQKPYWDYYKACVTYAFQDGSWKPVAE